MAKIKLWHYRLLFVLKAHFMTLFVIMFTMFQVHEYQHQQENKLLFKKSILVNRNYALIFFIGFSFYGFLLLTFFRKPMENFQWWINLLITSVMVWFSFPQLFLPLLSSKLWEWYYSIAITIGLMATHTTLAMFKNPIYEFTSTVFIKWSIRGFICSSLGILLAIAWKSSHMDVIVAYISLVFYSALIFIFGRTFGSVEFYVNEIQSNEWYYIILMHYNFIMTFSLIVLGMCKTRCILASKHKVLHGPFDVHPIH